jgi:hypothetical protein
VADPRQLFRRRPFHGEDDQVGGNAGPQFVQHQPAGLGAAGRQEIRHVAMDIHM